MPTKLRTGYTINKSLQRYNYAYTNLLVQPSYGVFFSVEYMAISWQLCDIWSYMWVSL